MMKHVLAKSGYIHKQIGQNNRVGRSKGAEKKEGGMMEMEKWARK